MSTLGRFASNFSLLQRVGGICLKQNNTCFTPKKGIKIPRLHQKWMSSSAAAVAMEFASSETRSDLPDPMKMSEADKSRLSKLRNIGISAHIDSGKTTLTERVLFYTGRIDEIHEVRGKDSVGAKMDSMELEREKGITIQSAATYARWKEYNFNIIDTPGHVDFTIEVERALRVLDGAVLVLCAVGGVQSQTLTVDRQMKRYDVPRIAFINKMDRTGANPFRVIGQIRSKLKLSAAAVQVPIGSESEFKGVVDLVHMKAYYNKGEKGETIEEGPIPEELSSFVADKRGELIEMLADVHDDVAEAFLEERTPDADTLQRAIRESTLNLKFMPVFMGSAYHNKSVQPLLDGVVNYLPAPYEVNNYGLDIDQGENKIQLSNSSDEPLIGLAFKLEEGRFGQLTYIRVYQGSLRRGMNVINVRTGKKIKLSRVVRMHSNEMEDVESIGSGEICALFGIECASGDTFTDGKVNFAMSSMFVPSPVISLAIEPKGKNEINFSKALARFQREDPTFRVHVDSDSKQTIISGMGELHLEIYVERMKREYKVDTITGKPQVAYRERVTKKATFEETFKKQSGGSGQFAKIKGYIEPLEDGVTEEGEDFEFVNATVGMNIPHQFIPAIEKGFKEACEKGILIGSPIKECRFVIEDGLAHMVDSSEYSFKTATMLAMVNTFPKASPQILEPIMSVHMSCPAEFQNAAISLLNKRKGTITNSEVIDDYVEVDAEVSLNDMFGFSSDLRSVTQGKGEFSMEYLRHSPVFPQVQEQLIADYLKEKSEKNLKKKK